jgi:hypothetical protein
MNSRKEVNKEHYRRKKDSIKAKYSPAQHKATYILPSTKETQILPSWEKTPTQRYIHPSTEETPIRRYILSSSKETLYNPTQRKLQHKAAYSPAKKKLETSDDRNQKVVNEDLIRTHTNWSWQSYAKWWSEPFDLLLLQARTNYDWSLAAVDGVVDSARYDMAAQCGVCGQPKSDLIRTHTKSSWRPYARWWSEPLDLRLQQAQTNYDWSLAAVNY